MYFFTITISPKYYEMRPLQQYIHFRKEFEHCFAKWFYEASAELTKKNNIHFHAIVHITKQELPLVTKALKKAFGWHKVDPVKRVNYTKCLKYLYKSVYKTSKVLGMSSSFTAHETLTDNQYKLGMEERLANDIQINEFMADAEGDDDVVDI